MTPKPHHPTPSATTRSPTASWRAALAPAGLAAAAAGAMAYLGAVSPYAAGNYPSCPTWALLGVYCPGCGSLRAMHELANLDVVAAWGMNPFAVLMVPVLVGLWLGWARRRVTGRPRTWLAPPWVLHVLLVAVVGYAVLRNVPGLAPWLAP